MTPFASFPFEAVQLDIKGLDPSRIESTWPVADFDARIDVRADKNQSLKGQVAVKNSKPGPFDRNEVPVRFLKGKIEGMSITFC